MAGVAPPEPELSGYVLVPILEDQDGGLVDLQSAVTILANSKVDVGLLARAHAAIDLADDTAAEHLEEDHSGPGVQDLFRGGTVGLVLVAIASILLGDVQEWVGNGARKMMVVVGGLAQVDSVFKPLPKYNDKGGGKKEITKCHYKPRNLCATAQGSSWGGPGYIESGEDLSIM